MMSKGSFVSGFERNQYVGTRKQMKLHVHKLHKSQINSGRRLALISTTFISSSRAGLPKMDLAVLPESTEVCRHVPKCPADTSDKLPQTPSWREDDKPLFPDGWMPPPEEV